MDKTNFFWVIIIVNQRLAARPLSTKVCLVKLEPNFCHKTGHIRFGVATTRNFERFKRNQPVSASRQVGATPWPCKASTPWPCIMEKSLVPQEDLYGHQGLNRNVRVFGGPNCQVDKQKLLVGVCCAVLCCECAPVCFLGPVSLQVKLDLKRRHTHGNFKPIFQAICGNLICNSCLHLPIYSEENKDFRLPSSPCSKATFEFWSTPKHAEPSLLHKVRYIIITKYHHVMFHEHEEILKWRIWPVIPHLDITHFDFKCGVRSLQHPKHMDANRSQPQFLQLVMICSNTVLHGIWWNTRFGLGFFPANLLSTEARRVFGASFGPFWAWQIGTAVGRKFDLWTWFNH